MCNKTLSINQTCLNIYEKLKNNKSNVDIDITEDFKLDDIKNAYLFKTKTERGQYRTYKFGYTADNPSYEYMKYKIFNESGAPNMGKTFYTLNLERAKKYFKDELDKLVHEYGTSKLKEIYEKLTEKFLFNEYVIEDKFNVYITFDNINTRGKPLSNLEMLKNRLIYLTTLYSEEELDKAAQQDLRKNINKAWKEIYHQLGRNSDNPLDDDEFLRGHWIMHFGYKRNRGGYDRFLLKEKFSSKKVSRKSQNALNPEEISTYVDSIKESAVHWFDSYYPDLSTNLSEQEKRWIKRLNRVGMGYFRPLVMSILKNGQKLESESEKRIELLKNIERFIFVVFRLGQARSHLGSSKFYTASTQFNAGEISIKDIKNQIIDVSSRYFLHNDNETLDEKHFKAHIENKFNYEKIGYYGWNTIRYFLYEYESHLAYQRGQSKVRFEELKEDSIEHIFPQTPTDSWRQYFTNENEDDYYRGSLGNLLLLSKSINISLRNYSFEDKKRPKYNNARQKIRNGYSDGSHSEIEVSEYEEWTPKQIKERGIKLLEFMEHRWKIKFRTDDAKEDLLFFPEPES